MTWSFFSKTSMMHTRRNMYSA